LNRKLGHDYLFFANLKAYDAPWTRLCSVIESAIGNPKLYHTEKRHASGFRGRGSGGYTAQKANKT